MSRKLHIFTAYYPSSKFEVYLDNELQYADGIFDKVIFYPAKFTESTRTLKDNQEVIMPENSEKSKFYFLGKYADQIFKLLVLEMKSRGVFKVLKNRSYLFQYLFSQIRNLDRYRSILKNCKYDKFYSNWSVDSSLCLSLLKEYGIIDGFVTRAHRYDLYDEEYPIGFIPFRSYQQNQVNWIGSISADGQNYYREHFPCFYNKVFLFRLGTNDLGISPIWKSGAIRIVSCSNIKKVKRLHLIVQSLQKCDQQIEWHHFGDGDFRVEIEKSTAILPNNIKAVFHGRILAEELYDFYRNHPVTCFLNLSSSEGIPVSIMEAISFGIPVIATNVGGTSEIINEKTGILLKEDFDVNELAELLNSIENSHLVKEGFRVGVRNFWSDNFNSEKCFPSFMQKLSEN